MSKLCFLLISLILISCGPNNSKVAKETINETDSLVKKTLPKQKKDSLPKVDTMTVEELAVAKRVNALRAVKMANDTFKIIKKVPIANLPVDISNGDAIILEGVVSAKGKYYVPVRYSSVAQIGRDIFIGKIGYYQYDEKVVTPTYNELYQVIYRGKMVGKPSLLWDVKPLIHHGRVAGFLKTLHVVEDDEQYFYYIDINGNGWDILHDLSGQTFPMFEHYTIKGNILTLWGGAPNPQDLQAFFPEDRALYRVDLNSGMVLDNPFITTEE